VSRVVLQASREQHSRTLSGHTARSLGGTSRFDTRVQCLPKHAALLSVHLVVCHSDALQLARCHAVCSHVLQDSISSQPHPSSTSAHLQGTRQSQVSHVKMQWLLSISSNMSRRGQMMAVTGCTR
jgi:hypothetical protein